MSVVAKPVGVAASSAYLWMKAASGASAPVFARVLPTRRETVRVEVGGAAVVVEVGFDAELLRQVVAALGRAS